MKTRLARHITDLHPVPLYAVVLASITSLILILIHLMGWQLWLVAILILIAWSPIFFLTARALYRQHRWLAFFFVLLVAQSVHFTEHIAQMIQIHILGLSGSMAHGIIVETTWREQDRLSKNSPDYRYSHWRFGKVLRL